MKIEVQVRYGISGTDRVISKNTLLSGCLKHTYQLLCGLFCGHCVLLETGVSGGLKSWPSRNIITA
jgi:hypothetical protein